MSNSIDLDHLIAQLVQATAQLLARAQKKLRQIQWQDGEANTDSGYSQLARTKFRQAFKKLRNQHPEIQLVECKNPDISFTIRSNSETRTSKVELKSCKANPDDPAVILGSTIGKLDFNMWVIFCRRSLDNQTFEFRYGRYFRGIFDSPTKLFQDRTPRPRMSWDGYQRVNEPPNLEKLDEASGWIKKYAEAAINRISGKYPVKYSWQDDLVKEIIKIAIEKGITGE